MMTLIIIIIILIIIFVIVVVVVVVVVVTFSKNLINMIIPKNQNKIYILLI